jgi:hypothetical protein
MVFFSAHGNEMFPRFFFVFVPCGTQHSRVSGHELGVLLLSLGPVLEGADGEVDLGDGLGDNLGAEALRLGTELVHHVGASDALREAGEVLDIGGGGELASGGKAEMSATGMMTTNRRK